MADEPINLTLIRNQRAAQSDDSVEKVLKEILKDNEEVQWARGMFILIRYDETEDMFWTDVKYANCDALISRGMLLSALIEDTAYHIEGEE